MLKGVLKRITMLSKISLIVKLRPIILFSGMTDMEGILQISFNNAFKQ